MNLIAFAAVAARRTLRGSPSARSGRAFFVCCDGNSRGTNSAKNLQKCYERVRQTSVNSLISLVGAPRFELGTPSPPDWCANGSLLLGETPDVPVRESRRGPIRPIRRGQSGRKGPRLESEPPLSGTGYRNGLIRRAVLFPVPSYGFFAFPAPTLMARVCLVGP